MTRRRLLELGFAAATVGALDPLAISRAGTAARPWPSAVLGAAEARTVDPRQFMPLGQLRAWALELDAVGLRATGTPAHERYVDVLRGRLARVGVQHLHFDPVPITRWTTDDWRLAVVGGPKSGRVPTASYIPYSGRTSVHGVSGPLVGLARVSPPRLVRWPARSSSSTCLRRL